MRGLIVRSQSGFYAVETSQGSRVCRLRGRLKKGPRQGDVAAIGDWVQISLEGQQRGMIEAVEPRRHVISRMAPTPRGEYEQILIANPDQAVFVFSCAEPEPRFGMLDRFLVTAERQHLQALIVANKADLLGMANTEARFQRYADIGYPVLATSARLGWGLEALSERLAEKISALTGPSGVGKSSLLNRIIPGLDLEAREVSQATSKGRHTTVVRELHRLPQGGYVADTPGLKALALWDINPEELDAYFPELRQRVAQCEFSDCSHQHEPGCAVLEALEAGEIHPERYQSYLRIRLGEEELAG